MNLTRIFPILIFSLFFANLYVIADTIDLGTIVITPHKRATDSSHLSVESLDTDELYEKGNYRLADALKTNPSIMTVQSGGLSGATSIFLRGNASYHTRFLLDGVKLYDPILTQSYYNSSHLTLNGIDKIEISKGPNSCIYGSDAIAGIINLSSRKANSPLGFSYLQEFGSYHTFTEQLDFETAKDPFGCVLTVFRTDSGGFSATKEDEGNCEDDPYHGLNVSLRADYACTETVNLTTVSRFNYARYQYDRTNPTNNIPEDDPDRLGSNFETMVTTFCDHKISDTLSQRVQIAYTRFKRKYKDNSDNIDDWYKAKTYQAQWYLGYDPANFCQLTSGIDYTREKADSYTTSSDFPKKTMSEKGIFGEVIFPWHDTSLALSYRQDKYSFFNWVGSHRSCLSHKIAKTKTTIRAIYAEGFKAPSLYQLYAPSSSSFGPIGNVNLQEEQSKNYEFGLEQKYNKCTLTTTYFRTYFKNLIQFTTGQGYENIDQAQITGWENQIQYCLNDQLTCTIGYTYLDTKNKTTNQELPLRPKNKASFQLTGKFDAWLASLDISYIGNRREDSNIKLKSYVLANLALTYHLRADFDLFLRIENFLDKDYSVRNHYQVKRRSIYGGFKYLF